MQLLYINEHLSCLNYEGGSSPTIEIKNILKRKLWKTEAQVAKIIFITKGAIKISFGDIEEEIQQGKIILIPPATKLKILAKEDTCITIFRLRVQIRLCDRYSLEQLLRDENINTVKKQNFLDINPIMSGYINMLNTCIIDQLRCIYFFEIKIKELFFLLRAYYSKKKLLCFFYPLLSQDTRFSDLILRNYNKIKTVKDLADLTHYSISGFEKRFKRVFGISPFKWLKQQKAKNIYHEINCSGKTFKEISLEYDFNSPAHLNNFCKINFGDTPGNIRKLNNIST